MIMTDSTETTGQAGILALDDAVSIAYHRRSGKRDLAGAGLPGVVFLGGFMSDMTGSKAQALEAFCVARGQAYVRFDYQGHGISSGRFEDGSIGRWVGDAVAVLDRLTEGPQILVGSSMGGWLMQRAALARPARVAGLVGIATATDFTEELIWPSLDEAARRRLMAEGRVAVPSDYAAAGYTITRTLIEDGRRHLLFGTAPIPITCPVRLLHGTADRDVPWQLSTRLADALAATDVVVTLIKGGDHRLSTPSDLARIAAAVAELTDLASPRP
jgi:pimeloyl-ACP methyl ester carboxylesterase